MSLTSAPLSDPENAISPRNPNRNSKKGRAPEPPSKPQATKQGKHYFMFFDYYDILLKLLNCLKQFTLFLSLESENGKPTPPDRPQAIQRPNSHTNSDGIYIILR